MWLLWIQVVCRPCRKEKIKLAEATPTAGFECNAFCDAMQERIQAMSTKMTEPQVHALKHIYHKFKKADKEGKISLMDLLMAMRDDGQVRKRRMRVLLR